MADGYLESHYAEYEKRKAEWLRKQGKRSSNAPTGKKNPWSDYSY